MKKLLAFLLVLTMVLSLVPATFAAGTMYDYVFSSTALGVTSGTSILKGAYTFPGDYSNIVSAVSSPWSLLAYRRDNNMISVYEDRLAFRRGTDGSVPIKSDLTAVFKIKVDAAGTYSPSISFKSETYSYIANIYLVPNPDSLSLADAGSVMTTTNALSNDYKIGTVDFYGPAQKKTVALEGVTLEAGEYALFVAGSGSVNPNAAALSGSYWWLDLVSFTLDATEVTAVDASFDGEILGVGASAELTTKVTRSSGKTALTKEGLSFVSDNTSVVEVSDKGVVTGKAAGSATVTVSTSGGVSKTVDILVYNSEADSFKYDLTYKSLKTPLTDSTNDWTKFPQEYSEINLTKSAPWKFEAMGLRRGNPKDNMTFNWKSNGLYYAGVTTRIADKYTWVAYNIFVPKGGIYEIAVEPRKGTDGAIASFYIENTQSIDYAAWVAEAKSNLYTTVVSNVANPYGTVNFYDATKTRDDKCPAETLEKKFTAANPGNYLLVCALTDTDAASSGTYRMMMLESVTLNTYDPNPNPVITETTLSYAITAEDDTGSPVVSAIQSAGYTQGDVANVTVGNTVSATAKAVTGKTFLYWVNKTTGNIISRNATESFVIGTKTPIAAVYGNTKESDGKISAEFYNKNGKLIERKRFTPGTAFTYPTNPELIGYTFDKWSATYTTAPEDNVILVAEYNTPAKDKSISVNGTAGSYAFNEKITATAAAQSGGVNFSHWTKNGKIVSNSLEYSFYAFNDATVTPVYNATAEVIYPSVVLEYDAASGAYMAEVVGIAKENIIEKGILFSTGSDIAISSYAKKAVSETDATQFTAIGGAGYNARGYLVYHDGTQIRVAYSD